MNQQASRKLKMNQSGFTLIEAMVAIAVFTIVMVIGISALLNVNNTNKKSQSLRTVIDTINFAMEDMSRNFKLGSQYHCVSGSDPLIVQGGVPNDFLALPQDCNDGTHTGFLAASLEPTNGTPADQSAGLANAFDQVVYMFELLDSSIPGSGPDVCTLKKSLDGGVSFSTMLPPEVHIACSASGFNVFNTSDGAFAASPRIVIRISGTVTYKEVVTPFSLQTTASQRNISVTTP